MQQPSLIPETPVEPLPQLDDTCPKCGTDRDKILVRLFEINLRLRSRLAKLDPGGEIL